MEPRRYVGICGTLACDELSCTADCGFAGCEYHFYTTQESLKRAVNLARVALQTHLNRAHRLKSDEYELKLVFKSAHVAT